MNRFTLRWIVAGLTAALLIVTDTAAQAAVTWDSDGATAGQLDGPGAWLDPGLWWDGANNVNWSSGDDAIFGVGGTGGAVTLASPTTVNSLTINSFSGTYMLGTAGQTITLNNGITMNSGAGAATIISPITLGGAQSWLNNSTSLLTVGTGAVTNGGFLLTIGGTGNTTISSVIGGVGGLAKTGAGLLTLSSGSNTFTGQLTVANGTLSIGSINGINANGTLGNTWLPVILGSSGNTGTLQYTGGNNSSTKPFRLAAGGTGAFDVTVGANTLTLNGVIYGSGGLTKTGAGTLTLSPGGGTSSIQNQFTGMTTVTAGRLKLGTQGALAMSPYDTTGASATVGLDASSVSGLPQSMGVLLGGLSGSVNLDTTMMPGYGAKDQLILNPQTGTSVTYGGVIGNGSSAALKLTKTGPGTQTLTGANSYTGITYVYAGTLALSGASGTALSSASYDVRGGTLLLDNSTAWADRLADAKTISLGSLTLKSDNGGIPQTETVGTTTFATGGKVTIDNGTGAGTTLSMTGTASRSTGAAIDFVGLGGTLGSGAGNPNVTAGTLPANANGILPWATVGGTSWAENNSNSIRAYSGTFVDPTSAASDATNNAQLTGSGAMGSAKSFNSLNVIASGAGQSLSLGGNLTLTSPGAILKSGTDAYTISGTGNITAGTELIAHVDGGALTISAPLNTAIVGIAKGGAGNLILSGTRAGTLSGAIGIAGGQLEFQGASTTISGVISGAGGITVNLNSGQMLTYTNQGNNYSGPTIVKGGILNIGSNNGVLSQLPATHGNAAYFNWNNGGTQIAQLSNVELNGGILGVSYVSGAFLGSGPGQLRITGGTSGITMNGNGPFTFAADSNYEVVWGALGQGAATGYFNPSTFVMNESAAGASPNLTIANRFDLNGADRTIAVNSGSAPGILSGVIRNSSGTAGITKIGPGTLALSGANTYNGATTVSAGTLQLGSGGTGGALSTSSAISVTLGAFFAINRTNTVTQGTDFSGAAITGAGGFIQAGSGTTVLNAANTYTGPTILNAGTLSVGAANNLGDPAANLVFNGGTLRITGTTLNNFTSLGRTVVFNPGAPVILDINDAANTFTFDQSLPTAGLALAGAGTVAFQSGVPALTLNVPAGVTTTYSGVIPDGSGVRTLTKTGAGTQVLQGINTYTGTTTLNAGTLTLSGASGAIASTAINLNGGGLTLDNTTNSGARVSDSAVVTVNGNSALTFSHAGAAGTDYAETIDTLSLQSGFLTYTSSQANATGPRTSNLLFTNLSRTGASNTSTVNFAGTGLGTNTRNTITFGSGVTHGLDLGPWAVVNGADFASYSTANGIVAAANTTLTATSNDNTINWKLTGGNITITAGLNPSYKTLLVSDTTARTLDLSGNTVSVGGISASGNKHVINATGGGALQPLNTGDPFYIINGGTTANYLTINPVIQNNGATPTTLAVFGGSGTYGNGNYGVWLNGANTFTGGVVINGGTLAFNSDVKALGTNNNITFAGTGALVIQQTGSYTTTGTLTVNEGANAYLQNWGNSSSSFAFGSTVGSGTITLIPYKGSPTFNLGSASSFTGSLNPGSGGSGGSTAFIFTSLGDGTGSYLYGSNNYPGSGMYQNNDSVTMNSRALNFGSNFGISLGGSGSWTIGSDIVNTGTGNTLTLAGSGNSSISGKLTNGLGALAVTVSGGTWALSGANTYSGTTKISGGILSVGNALALQNSPLDTLNSVTGTASAGLRTTTTTLTLGGLTGNKNLASVFTTTFGDYSSVTALTLNPGTGATPSYSGVIADGATGMSLTKTGAGTQTLTGANTYTGATNVNAGTLQVTGSIASTSVTVASGAVLGLANTAGAALAAGSSASVTNDGTMNVSSLSEQAGAISGTTGTTNVTSSLTADSIVQNTLTIGAGGSVTIRETPGAAGGAQAVPEPGTWVLIGIGLLSLLAFRRRR